MAGTPSDRADIADRIRASKAARESYIGSWLPEPLLEDESPSPADEAELSESVSVSTAFLVLLETLNPIERALPPPRGLRLRLLEVLTEDVVVIGDGGGKGPAIRRPLEGAERVARAVIGFAALASRVDVRFEPATVNGQPGARTVTPDGRLATGRRARCGSRRHSRDSIRDQPRQARSPGRGRRCPLTAPGTP